MRDCFRTDDMLDRYLDGRMLDMAQEVLREKDQSEEAFLGAKCVLLLHGLI